MPKRARSKGRTADTSRARAKGRATRHAKRPIRALVNTARPCASDRSNPAASPSNRKASTRAQRSMRSWLLVRGRPHPSTPPPMDEMATVPSPTGRVCAGSTRPLRPTDQCCPSGIAAPNRAPGATGAVKPKVTTPLAVASRNGAAAPEEESGGRSATVLVGMGAVAWLGSGVGETSATSASFTERAVASARPSQLDASSTSERPVPSEFRIDER